MGRGEPAPALPEIQAALLVEDFGPGALDGDYGALDLLMLRRVLNVRDVYRYAGTKQQSRLSEAQWQLVFEIDEMAAEDAN
jgi:hypothetical protein